MPAAATRRAALAPTPRLIAFYVNLTQLGGSRRCPDPAVLRGLNEMPPAMRLCAGSCKRRDPQISSGFSQSIDHYGTGVSGMTLPV